MLDLIKRDKEALKEKLLLPSGKYTKEKIENFLYVLENKNSGMNIQKLAEIFEKFAEIKEWLGDIFENFVEIKEWNEFLLVEARRRAGSGHKSEEDYNEAVDALISVVADDFWYYTTSDNQDLIFRV